MWRKVCSGEKVGRQKGENNGKEGAEEKRKKENDKLASGSDHYPRMQT